MVEKDLGFVIRRYNFRETSLIATLYTQRFGKMRGIFKGFYSTKKEFSSNLNIFTLNEFIFYPKKRDIWLVSFADSVRDYDYLRTSLAKNKIASEFSSIIDKTLELWEANSEIFSLFKTCLEALDQKNENKISYIFFIKFLTISGLKPEFNRCLSCHNQFCAEEVFFSVSRGGLICGNCFKKVSDCYKINRETSRSISYIQHASFPQVLRLNPTRDCEKEIITILKKFLLYHLDFSLK